MEPSDSYAHRPMHQQAPDSLVQQSWREDCPNEQMTAEMGGRGGEGEEAERVEQGGEDMMGLSCGCRWVRRGWSRVEDRGNGESEVDRAHKVGDEGLEGDDRHGVGCDPVVGLREIDTASPDRQRGVRGQESAGSLRRQRIASTEGEEGDVLQCDDERCENEWRRRRAYALKSASLPRKEDEEREIGRPSEGRQKKNNEAELDSCC